MTPGSSDLNKANARINELERHNPGGPPPPTVRLFATITDIKADSLVVDLGGGATVEVLKPAKVCPALDQDVDGFTYDYSPGGDEKQKRTSTGGGNTETQVVVPKFIVGDLVEIGPAPWNVADHAASLSAYTLQIVNHPAYWSKESGS